MAETADRTLHDLSPGQDGIILSVGIHSGAVKRRLVDMGLTPGTRITVKKIAPFGDPIEVRVRATSCRSGRATRSISASATCRRKGR
jgi:ferrous iron transport protein B